MISLICPTCKQTLTVFGAEQKCTLCGFALANQGGVWVDPSVVQERDKDYYDTIYHNEHGQKWFQGLNRQNFLKKILETISLAYRRERFFRRHIKGTDKTILDLACGAGRDYFTKFGYVVGVDLSYDALKIAKDRYQLVIQSGVMRLPFPDESFDYVISSDFLGHVRNEDKDVLQQEIRRVMKKDGQTIHVIETDSNNIFFRFAHRYPDLFQEYFVEKIGGHIGLELPTDCVARWEKNGFSLPVVKKIWGVIWPIQYYIDSFDGKYKEKSRAIRALVYIAKALSNVKIVQVAVNIILNPINSLVESLTPLDRGQGLMIVGEKKIKMGEEAGNFTYNFSAEPTGTHMLLLDSIKPQATVLDVGCASGYLGHWLRLRQQVKVWGIEPMAEVAAVARAQGYEDVFVGNVESILVSGVLGGKKFDHILLGDVFEHLLDPVAALRALIPCLAPQGTLIISVPNVAHYSVRLNLLRGRWDMTDTGILDRTHVHFYTQKTAHEMLVSAGLRVRSVRPRGDIERWLKRIGLGSVGQWILQQWPGWWAVQNVFVAEADIK